LTDSIHQPVLLGSEKTWPASTDILFSKPTQYPCFIFTKLPIDTMYATTWHYYIIKIMHPPRRAKKHMQFHDWKLKELY